MSQPSADANASPSHHDHVVASDATDVTMGQHPAAHEDASAPTNEDVSTAADAINDIASFWRAENHPQASDVDAKIEAEQNGSAQNLAVEAARYDPFKGTELEHRSKDPSVRDYAASFGGSKGYPPQLAVFPGQNASRDDGQSASALKDHDAVTSNGQDEHHSNEFADLEPQDPTDDRGMVVSNQFSHDTLPPGSEYTHDDHAYHEEDPQQQHHHHHQHANAFDQSADASQADFSMNQHVGLSSSGPQDTSTDADMSTASTAGIKRKKNYKYLQDEPPLDASGQRPPSEKRKKVQKACRPCKRSHMPCQEQRPCPRCIKRGIPDLCVDAEPITRRPRKYGDADAADETSERASEIQQLAQAAEAAAAAAQGSGEADTGGELAAQQPVEEKYLPGLDDISDQNLEQIRKLLRPTEEDILDQFATLPLRLLANPSLLPSEDPPANEFDGAERGNKYSYTRSYAELARYAVEKLSLQGGIKLEEIIKEARSSALKAGLAIEPSQIRELELEFHHAVSHMRDSIINEVPVPMLITRRTGEIYAANKHAVQRFDLPEVMTNESMGNIIQFGPERTNLRIAELLLQSLTKSIGGVVSATVGFRPRASDKTDKKFVLSMETRYGSKGEVPLLVAVTLTPLEAIREG